MWIIKFNCSIITTTIFCSLLFSKKGFIFFVVPQTHKMQHHLLYENCCVNYFFQIISERIKWVVISKVTQGGVWKRSLLRFIFFSSNSLSCISNRLFQIHTLLTWISINDGLMSQRPLNEPWRWHKYILFDFRPSSSLPT